MALDPVTPPVWSGVTLTFISSGSSRRLVLGAFFCLFVFGYGGYIMFIL